MALPPLDQPPVTTWQSLIEERDWYWRGWQIRYAFIPCQDPTSQHPPFLLIHGFGAALGHWRHNLEALSQHAPVYAIDLLGYGHSQKEATQYSVPFWAEQIYAFWQQFIHTPVVLVGNSLGSLVSLTVASTYSRMVAGAVFLNLPDSSVLQAQWPKWLRSQLPRFNTYVHPVGRRLAQVLTAPWIFIPFFKWIRHPKQIRFWAKQAYTRPEAVDDELVQILSQPPYDFGAARALVAMTLSPQGARPATSLLPRLSLPMLLVWGKDDRFVPATLARLFRPYNRNLDVIELERVGHCPHDECPALINRMILDWVSVWQTR